MKTRRLDDRGRLPVGGTKTPLTRVLAGEPVGLEQLDDETWEIFYGPIPIAELHMRNKDVNIKRIG